MKLPLTETQVYQDWNLVIRSLLIVLPKKIKLPAIWEGGKIKIADKFFITVAMNNVNTNPYVEIKLNEGEKQLCSLRYEGSRELIYSVLSIIILFKLQ